MEKYLEILKKNVTSSIQNKENFLKDESQMRAFAEVVSVIVKCYKNGGRLLIAGNGGSAADSQHLAAEFVSKLARTRNPLPAEALTTDTSALTAIGNDYGYEHVFSRQIQGKARPEDVFLGITTSGRSPNILQAFKMCHSMKIPCILLGGKGGGPAKELADYSIVVPGEETSHIQELHMTVYHTLCGCVEDEICFS